MANLIIKSSADNLVLKGSGQTGSDTAITISTTGNTTLAGTANNIGTVTAGTIGSDVQVVDLGVDGWHFNMNASIDQNTSGVLDFQEQIHKGSNITESAGTITVGTAGWYLVMAHMSNDASKDDTNEWYAYKNGSHYGHRTYMSTAAEIEYLGQSVSLIVELAATNTIAWRGKGNLYGAAAPDGMTYFMGFRLGK